MIKSLKYNLIEYKNVLLIYYLVVLASEIISVILSFAFKSSSSSFSGYNIATSIFIFIFGLVTFKEHFHMFLQNGLTRKSIFLGELSSKIVLCAVMSFIDSLFSVIASFIASFNDNLFFSTLYDSIFSERALSLSPVELFFEGLIFHFGLYLLLFAIATTIALITYRTNRIGKILVFAGVPSFFLIILPIIDEVLFNNAIYSSIFDFISWCLRLIANNSLIGVVFALCISAIFEAASFLLIRKANKR